jgi:arylsulfatase A-like enzyme
MSGSICNFTLAVALGCTPFDPKPPDIVLVMLDTLRPDHLELHGYEKRTAPFLASMGERSAVFINALSTSSCTAPVVASLFTGLYPTQPGTGLMCLV